MIFTLDINSHTRVIIRPGWCKNGTNKRLHQLREKKKLKRIVSQEVLGFHEGVRKSRWGAEDTAPTHKTCQTLTFVFFVTSWYRDLTELSRVEVGNFIPPGQSS